MEKKVRLKNDLGDILYPITKAEYIDGLETPESDYLYKDSKEVVVVLDSLYRATTSAEIDACFPNGNTPTLSELLNNIGKRLKVLAAPRIATAYSYVTIMPASDGVILAYPNRINLKENKYPHTYISLEGVILTAGTDSLPFTVTDVDQRIMTAESSELEPVGIGYYLSDGRKIDYSIVKSEDIDSYIDKILGVYLLKDGISILIGKKQSKQYWSNGQLAVPTLDITTINNSLNKYPDGLYLTNEVLKYVPSTEGWACKYCYNLTINGLHGYLWSYREAAVVRKYFSTVHWLITACGGDLFVAENYWTSVPLERKNYSTDPKTALNYVCIVKLSSDYVDGGNVQGYYWARPIWKFESSSYIAPATPTSNGSMSADDKAKLDALSTEVDTTLYDSLPEYLYTSPSDGLVTQSTNSVALVFLEYVKSGNGSYEADAKESWVIDPATTAAAGVMSSADKTKLDKIDLLAVSGTTFNKVTLGNNSEIRAGALIGTNVKIGYDTNHTICFNDGVIIDLDDIERNAGSSSGSCKVPASSTINNNVTIGSGVTIGTYVKVKSNDSGTWPAEITIGTLGTLLIGSGTNLTYIGNNIYMLMKGDTLETYNTSKHDISLKLGSGDTATYILNGVKIGQWVEIGWNGSHSIKFSDGTVIDFDSILNSANLAE